MTTDTSEKGLESLFVRHMTGTDGLAVPGAVTQPPAPYGGTGYFAGSPKDFDRAHALDVAQLLAFLRATQPEGFKKLAMADAHDATDINRLKFLGRLSAEVGKRGVIDVLRKGIEHHPAGHLDLFYGTPSQGNAKAAALHAKNRFSITRQFAYSTDESRRALDLGLFINGLPIGTFELKNSLTKQTVEDAVEQYRRDRNPPTHRAHGPRPGAGKGDADPAQGRYAGLQAVRRERVVPAFCWRYGVPANEPVTFKGASLRIRG